VVITRIVSGEEVAASCSRARVKRIHLWLKSSVI
jgi:hypothetical protein